MSNRRLAALTESIATSSSASSNRSRRHTVFAQNVVEAVLL